MLQEAEANGTCGDVADMYGHKAEAGRFAGGFALLFNGL